MKTSCKELKRIARQNLTGRYKIPMGAFVVAGLITFAIELPFSMLLQSEYATTFQTVIYYIVDFLISLLGIVLTAGVTDIHLKMARQQEYGLALTFGQMKARPDRFLTAGFFIMAITIGAMIPFAAGAVLWYRDASDERLMLFAALGIVSAVLAVYAALRLSLVLYILLDDDAVAPWQALKRSARMMRGQMGRLFYIYLSFIGMYLLGILTLGIGMLWIAPYQTQTLTQFYLDVRKEVSQDTFE